MKYISLFSGIGGFDLGFDRAGMECVLQVEKDKYARSVLETHWSDVPKMEDVRNVTRESVTGTVDLICGGFPCQDVSVAGNRAGLAGSRSGLWFEFHRIISEIRPQWVVIENVPGLLSSNEGRDFAVVLRGLVKCGYGVAYRILDSQNFGVPQRRRRVFIVGYFRGSCAADVLFESESVPGDIETGKETGQGAPATAYDLTGITSKTNRSNPEPEICHTLHSGSSRTLVTFKDPAPALGANFASKWGLDDQHINSGAGHFVASIDTRNDTVNGDISGTLQAKPNGGHSLNYTNPIVVKTDNTSSNGWGVLEDGTTHTLGGTQDAVAQNYGVRRLTPTECARLQGFPDNWHDGLSDAQAYKCYGNAVTVNVAEWIGRRIMTANNN